ncbi:MAG: hypothetical protein HQ538_01810 [Parcubacteria group bacterium]|nr:hypothetical protein [Parcubacteria group bacterium]
MTDCGRTSLEESLNSVFELKKIIEETLISTIRKYDEDNVCGNYPDEKILKESQNYIQKAMEYFTDRDIEKTQLKSHIKDYFKGGVDILISHSL